MKKRVMGYDFVDCLVKALDSTKSEKGVQILSVEHIAREAIRTITEEGFEVDSQIIDILDSIIADMPYIKESVVGIIEGKTASVDDYGSIGDIRPGSFLHSILCFLTEHYELPVTPISKYVSQLFDTWNDNIRDNYVICADLVKAIKFYSETTVGELFRQSGILENTNQLTWSRIRKRVMQESNDSLDSNNEDTDIEEDDEQQNTQSKSQNMDTSDTIPENLLLNEIEKMKNQLFMISEIKGSDFTSDPVIGRNKEVGLIAEKMLKRKRSNVVLLGDAGVGKTEIVNGLAYRIANGLIGGNISSDYLIYSMDVVDLMAGTRFRGELEAKLQMLSRILCELSNYHNIILFMDEIHLITGTGASGESSADIANLLKPMLTSGKVKIIGSTTFEEFNNIKKDKALNRRFETITIDEPSKSDTIEILKGVKPEYEKHFGLDVKDEILDKIVDLSDAYIKDKFFPDKAMEALDSTMAYCKFNSIPTVTEDAVVHTISEMSRIDISRIKTDKAQVKELDSTIKSSLFGQDKAVDKMVRIIKTYKAGFNDENKPIANVLFCGKTGTGKTELSKLLAENMDMKLQRFDMSEYAEEYTISKFIGSPAGYVGHNEGGLLTEAISKTPHCVLLLDEIEKAHPKIMSILLQVMDYGCLTDSSGKKVDFTNVIIIMTSNAGVNYKATKSIGFGSSVELGETDDLKSIEGVFAPEFLGRLDEIIKFNDINNEIATKVIDKELNKIKAKAEKNGYEVQVSDNVKEEILKRSNIKKLGARNIGKEVQKSITPLVVDYVLSDNENKTIEIKEI
jgi:ATP-dependent Clp protease ATP-binding subunit ClpA